MDCPWDFQKEIKLHKIKELKGNEGFNKPIMQKSLNTIHEKVIKIDEKNLNLRDNKP